MMRRTQSEPQFVLCIRNEGAEDLELRKVYQLLEDEPAAKDGYVRIIDESGEDYLYPAEYFIRLELPEAAVSALKLTA